MKKLFGILGLIIAGILFFTIGCQKNELNESKGRLVINLTDGPFSIDLIEEANITITKAEIRAVDDTIGNPFITISEDTMEFNLLELRNGVMAELLEIELPVRQYDLIRIYVDEASLKLKSGEVFDVKVPSGSQTGIKVFIKPAIVIKGGLSSELLLDFSLDKSFVLKGNMYTPAGIKGFNFKPVIRAVNNSTAGRIEGIVTDTSNVKVVNAAVWLEKDSVIATSFTDTLGYYSIIGITAGTYDLFAAKENFDTLIIEDIKIFSGNVVNKNLTLIPK